MTSILHHIGHSGLFDAAFYLRCNPDLHALGSGALAHYHRHGWREGRRPNPYFDPRWYLSQNRDVIGDPLIHYISQGESEGRRPIAWFDPTWYAANHDVPAGALRLAHYLANRHKPDIRPMPEFDAAFYLRTYPDVAASGLDPLEHYMIQGFREARRPFDGFDPTFYRSRYLRHAPDLNPLLHFLQHRDRPGIHPALPEEETTIPREVRRRTQPGPFFENPRPLPESAIRRARILAYYLPQFHANPDNDRWWGTGFTEWTNVARGMPRFADHYQPRVPRDLGHYTLDDPGILRRQARMAREAGIEGFVFYFYWFNGARLLDGPLEMLLENPDIDLPFCLMWANENWSRRWDGSDDDLLISQDYRQEDETDLVACFARHMADPRYIRQNGRPLLTIYRPGTIPDASASIARWRKMFQDTHNEDPIFIMGQAFKDHDPRAFGMDGAIEFPPHKIVDRCALINDRLHVLDDDFTAQVYDYGEIVDQALAMPTPEFPLIRTVAPSWDNDARRQGHGLVMHGSTPPLYERWLASLIAQARRTPFFGEAFVCINAWNEWAEGAYLEPDQHFGSAYLNATARANTGFEHRHIDGRILLIGHDAFPAGAQTLLLAIGRSLRQQYGADILFVLLGDGALIDQYRAIAPVEILQPGDAATRARLKALHADGFSTALLNSAASTPLATDLHAAGINFIFLQHELPHLLQQRKLQTHVSQAQSYALETIVPSETLIDRRATSRAPSVMPQGLYKPVAFSSERRDTMRKQLGLSSQDHLIIGVGYADMRKGFDLFLQLWQRLHVDGTIHSPSKSVTHCVWVGDIDPALRDGLSLDIAHAVSLGTFHMPGQVNDVTPYLCAADAFALTSREDPYPSVVLEALACGLPCSAFARSGGIPNLIQQLMSEGERGHSVVPLGDLAAMAQQMTRAIRSSRARSNTDRKRMGKRLAARFSFTGYVEALHQRLTPDQPRLSVVVLSYNYGRYLAARLASIFAQRMPILEIIVIDDASTDDSIAIARKTAAEWKRDVRIVAGRVNSGSVFTQWRRAIEQARGDWVWIAEADDMSEPAHMAKLFSALKQSPDAVMAFCDSRSIDENGATLGASYKPYYSESIGSRLERDGLHHGRVFVHECLSERNLILNVSSAVFAREPLRAAMSRCRADLAKLQVAGDWRLYIELLDQPGAELVYVAETLNIHRRHDNSVTHSIGRAHHLTEVVRLQDNIAARFADNGTMRARQNGFRQTLIRQFGLRPRSVAAE